MNLLLLWSVTHDLGWQEWSDHFRDWDALELDSHFGTWWLHLLGEGWLRLLGLGWLWPWWLNHDLCLWLGLEVMTDNGCFGVWSLHHLSGNWRYLLCVVVHDWDWEDLSRHLTDDWLWRHLLGKVGDWAESTNWRNWDQHLADRLGVFVPVGLVGNVKC